MISEKLSDQKYINLETYRRNGIAVKTPVWFVRDGESIFVRTVSEAGKVRRIRNNEQVQIAACSVDGTLLEEWHPAKAREVRDGTIDRKVDQLLGQKYGLAKIMFGLVPVLQGRKYTILEVKERP